MIITTDGNIPSRFAHSFNIMKMAQGFYDSGDDVTLVSLLSLPNIIEKYKIKDIHNFYGISKNIKIKLLPVINPDFLYKRIKAGNFNLIATDFIKKIQPNFVYCRSYLTPYYCIQSGIPSIIETHTTKYNHPALQKLYTVVENKNFLGLVTIHENIKKEHIKRGVPEDKILVLEDGVDVKQFDIEDDRFKWRKKLNLPEDKKIIMYCGSLFKEKGIEDVLWTAKELNIHKDIVFILVGGNKKHIKYWKNFNHRNKTDNVIFTGFVSNSEVPEYLKSADILIMPYKTNLKYKIMDLNSTSPLKLFEYMASKRPIVTTNIPVVEKIVKHGESAMLAEPNNIKMLSEYVLSLLNNAEKSEFMAKFALEIAKKYSWKIRCETIIKKLVNK